MEPDGRSCENRSAAPDWEIEVFHDGACPLCRHEMAFLRRLDRRQRIRFTDISDIGFDPKTYGKSVDELMERIQGRLPDGGWLEGVEVFRRLYSAVGFSWLVAVTRWPGIARPLEWGYRLFARNRLSWTGRRRCTPESCQVPDRATPSDRSRDPA